jgi:hypothetical protein
MSKRFELAELPSEANTQPFETFDPEITELHTTLPQPDEHLRKAILPRFFNPWVLTAGAAGVAILAACGSTNIIPCPIFFTRR